MRSGIGTDYFRPGGSTHIALIIEHLAPFEDAIRMMYEAHVDPAPMRGLGWFPQWCELTRRTGDPDVREFLDAVLQHVLGKKTP